MSQWAETPQALDRSYGLPALPAGLEAGTALATPEGL